MNKKIYIIIVSVLFSIVVWISIAFSDSHYSVYKLPVEVIDIPEGYTVSEIEPEMITLRIRGDGWKLMSFELGGENKFFISAKGDSSRLITDPLAHIDNNPWLSAGINIIDVYPKSVKIYIEPIVWKKIQIVPQLNLDYKPGFGLASKIVLEPDSVLVSGPKSKMKKLNSYKTKPIEIKKLDQLTTVEAELENVKWFEPEIKSTMVKLDVQRIVENNYPEIVVNVINKPSNVEVVLIPNTINCTIRGGINILGKINPEDITAIVDYKDILNDTLEFIKPRVTLPEDVELIAIRPDRLKYVIKKY